MIITTSFEVGGGQVALQSLFSFEKREVTAIPVFAATYVAMRSGHSSLHRVSGLQAVAATQLGVDERAAGSRAGGCG